MRLNLKRTKSMLLTYLQVREKESLECWMENKQISTKASRFIFSEITQKFPIILLLLGHWKKSGHDLDLWNVLPTTYCTLTLSCMRRMVGSYDVSPFARTAINKNNRGS